MGGEDLLQSRTNASLSPFTVGVSAHTLLMVALTKLPPAEEAIRAGCLLLLADEPQLCTCCWWVLGMSHSFALCVGSCCA